jgi:excisionase family DNA binding protein
MQLETAVPDSNESSLPLLLPLLDAFAQLGIGRSKGYELISDGSIATVYIGSRRLVARTELERFVATLTERGDRTNAGAG